MSAPARDFQAEARAAKALALACVLAHTSALDEPESVLALDDLGWELAASAASTPSSKVNPPGTGATKHAVVAALRAIARDRDRHPDPFAAFQEAAR